MAREVYELRVNCNNSIKRVSDLKDCLNINSLLSEIEKLENESNKDDFWNDTKNAKQVLKTLNKNKENLSQIIKLENWYSDMGWRWPFNEVNGGEFIKLTSSYGYRMRPPFEFHGGIDVGIYNGIVIAPTDGVVVKCGTQNDAGNYIIIETENTVYNDSINKPTFARFSYS